MKTDTIAASTLSTFRFSAGGFTHLAREIIRKRLGLLNEGLIQFHDPLGEWLAGKGHRIDARVSVHDLRFYQQILIAGTKGAAAAYRDGWWECDDLTRLIRIMTRNIAVLDGVESGPAKLVNLLARVGHRLRSNTRDGSRDNIHAHYDLGNDLFELFLDPTLTYSAGIFRRPDMSMEEASIEKLDTICRKLALASHHHLVEIGSGWGSFAMHAARHYGCRVTTVTISQEQYDLASRRIREAGLDDRIEILLMDYRDLEGQYDRLVSIEMIEAVGHEFLPDYFGKCAALLKPDGRALIQAITMPDQRYDRYLKNTDFIQQFIFPGSCVPSLTAMINAITAATDFKVENIENIGPHYATTLRCWLERFMENRTGIAALGYSEEFLRLWEYYLCYCEAGFRERYLGNQHLLLYKPAADRPALDQY